MVLTIQARTSPPRLSTAPAQSALSSGPDARQVERRAEHHRCRAEALEVVGFAFLAGQCGDLIATRGQHVHRQAADAAGGAGDDHWTLARLQTIFFHAHDAQRGREPGRTEGHRFVQRQSGGQRDDPLRGHPGVLGVTTVVGDADVEAGRDDRITRPEARVAAR
jgi:hypothetical protein